MQKILGRVSGAVLMALVAASDGRAAYAAECALTVHVTPPTRTSRSVAHACEAGCAFTVQICRAPAGADCPGAAVAGVRIRSRPDAALATSVAIPSGADVCGAPSTILLQPRSRRRLRVIGVDADGYTLDRDRLMLDCRADPGWLGCVPVTTTTLATTTTTTTLPSGGCVVSGCSSELCLDHAEGSVCIWNPVFACYRTAECARQASGACGWTPSLALIDCLRSHGG